MYLLEKVGLDFLAVTIYQSRILLVVNLLCWFTDEWRIILDILNVHLSHPPWSLGLSYVSLF